MSQDIQSSREISPASVGRDFKHAIRANQAATDSFDETLAQFLGINRTDGRCLDIIDRVGRISAGALANESGLTTGAVTAVVDRLEAAGYARRVRDTLDRRKVWIEVTDEMRAITHRIFGQYERMAPALIGRFSPEQIQAIMEFLLIGTHVSTEMAAALREHLDPRATTPEARLIAARAFERAVEAGRLRLETEIADIRYALE